MRTITPRNNFVFVLCPPFYFPENSHFDKKKHNADVMKINCFLLNISFLFEKEYFFSPKK